MNNVKSTRGLDASSLDFARDLVCQLEVGNYEAAEGVIRELCKNKENDLFHEIGKLTRELHESLNGFNEDVRLKTIMSESMPDARERLDFVIKTMEQSTHDTLDAVEHCMPIVNSLNKRTVRLQKKMYDFSQIITDNEGLNVITKDLNKYLSQVVTDVKDIHSDLSDVLLAQSSQDITGQIIQRVISLVQEVEKGLVDMLCITSQAVMDEVKNKPANDTYGYGPAVPGVTKGSVLRDQSDVDDLLSTLGF